MRSTSILMSIFVLVPAMTWAAPEDVPPIIANGFSSYGGGVAGVVETWVKDGPLETNPRLCERALRKLGSAEALFGDYQNYEFIRSREWSSFSKTVFIALRYKNGAMFARFLLYQTKYSGWIVTDLAVDNDPMKIFRAKKPSAQTNDA